MATIATAPVLPATTRARRGNAERPSAFGTAILLLGVVYCLLPVVWVVMASTKNGSELFS